MASNQVLKNSTFSENPSKTTLAVPGGKMASKPSTPNIPRLDRVKVPAMKFEQYHDVSIKFIPRMCARE